MVATSIMYIGLSLTYASSFQMFRGSVIIFVGALSCAFLDRTLVKREWTGIVFIIIGLGVVGASDFMSTDGGDAVSRNNIITGDLLIILAQVITAVQMVYEERYVAGLDIPALQAVGWEGFFGFSVLGMLLVPMYFIKVGPPFNHNAHGVLEDLPDALIQMSNNYQLILAIIGTILSIAFFNFAGISVTKEISATTRMVLDSVRTLVIWIFALAIGWQQFHYLQVSFIFKKWLTGFYLNFSSQIIGFGGLLFGMCLYNNVFVLQSYAAIRRAFVNRGQSTDLNDSLIVNNEADDPAV